MSKQSSGQFALFNLGFRPFFLGAGLFAIVSITLWMLVYLFRFQFPLQSITSFQWHAHEMLYGYATAVIAGFLLTAVANWTNRETPRGWTLATLFGLWLLARIFFALGNMVAAAFFDLVFLFFLMLAVTVPIIKAKQWRQMSVLSKLIFIGVGNGLFYLGAFDLVDRGAYWGVYGGLYVVLGLILTMGRRIIPGFIERGVDEEVELFNSKWLDLSSLLFFLVFFVSEMLGPWPAISGWFALVVGIANALRLAGWHTPGLWRKSLLWSLYLSFWLITIGFFMLAASYFGELSKYLAIHALAFAGIGLITLSMMCRVSWGHTGRDVKHPPRVLHLVFALLVLGAAFRVLVPIIAPAFYTLWIMWASLFWNFSFVLFVIVYFLVFAGSRIDSPSG